MTENDQPEDETSAPTNETASDAPSADAPNADAPSADAPAEAREDAAVAAPKKKKKKAKTSDAESAEAIDDSPEGRQLKEAQVAFEVGDYAAARAIASKLAGHERAVIADGARDLLRRTDVDPAQMIFLAACLCALIGVAFYYLR